MRRADVLDATPQSNVLVPQGRESRWLEAWQSWDFSWHGRGDLAYLQASRVQVPASFPDGTVADGLTKTVSLKDYWRWSLGLPGKKRLLSDEELIKAGLLVQVGGEWFHLVHAPDIHLKTGATGEALPILQKIIEARVNLPLPRSWRDQRKASTSFAIPFTGAWLPGSIVRLAARYSDLQLDFCRLFDFDLADAVIGKLRCSGCMFSGHANFSRALILDEANFECAVFMGMSDFFETTFSKKVLAESAAFMGAVTFRDTKFNATVDFCGVKFDAFVDFKQVIFSGSCDFERAVFAKGASFHEPVFYGLFSFWDTNFLGEVTFTRITESRVSIYAGLPMDPTVRVGSAKFGVAEKFDLNAFRWTA